MANLLFYTSVLLILLFFGAKNYKILLILLPIFYHMNHAPLFQGIELFNLLNLTDITMIFISILLRNNVKKNNSDKLNKRYIKAALFYVAVCLTINIFLLSKSNIMFTDTFNLFNILTRSLRFGLYYFTLSTIFQRINSEEMINIFEVSLIVFVMFFSISTILYRPLQEIGIELSRVADRGGRTAGIFHANEIFFANTLAMIFGYFVGRLEYVKLSTIHVTTLVLILIGIINSGSRGGFLSIVLILAFFFIKKRRKKFRVILFLIILVFIVFNYFGEPLLDRVFQVSDEFRGNYTEVTNKYGGLNVRFYKWVNYLNLLKENPVYLILGNRHKIPFHYNPHNVFIFILFYGGLVPFFYFANSIRRLITLKKSSNPRSIRTLYILIPAVVMIMELNQWFYFMLPLLIMMSYGYNESELNIQIQVKE